MLGEARFSSVAPMEKILPGRRRLGRCLKAEEVTNARMQRVVGPGFEKCRQQESVGVTAGDSRTVQPNAGRPEQEIEIAGGVVECPPIERSFLADSEPDRDGLIAPTGAADPLPV